jgi:hypothetical protein
MPGRAIQQCRMSEEGPFGCKALFDGQGVSCLAVE